MSSLVSHHRSVIVATSFIHVVQFFDQLADHLKVLGMFSTTGLVSQSVYLAFYKVHGPSVFVAQVLVRNGDVESMASVFFSDVKSLVDENTFEIQNETEVVLERIHV